MAHNGNHRTIKINTNHKSIKTGFFVGRLLGWEMLRVEKRLPQAALHRPLQTDKPASSLVKVRKHYEEDGGTFHLHARDFSAGMVSYFGYFGHKTKQNKRIHSDTYWQIPRDPMTPSICICLLLSLSAPHPQSQSPVSWALARSHGRAPEVNPLSSKSICWNPRFQNFSIGTDSQNPSRTGASAKLSRLCIYAYIYQLPGGSATRPTGRTMYSKIRKICWVASQKVTTCDSQVSSGFMLNWRDKFGFPKLAAHLTLLPVIDEFCLLPLPVRKLAFVWLNARRLYEDSAPVAARKHIPVAAVNRVWCTLVTVISRDLFFVNVCTFAYICLTDLLLEYGCGHVSNSSLKG